MFYTKFSRFIIAASVCSGLFAALPATQAHASGTIFQAQTCASTTNFNFTQSYSSIKIFVEEGDVLTLSNGFHINLPATMQPLPGGARITAPASYTVPAGINEVNFEGNASIPTISCTKPAPAAEDDTGAGTTGSNVSANSQTNATRTGVSNNTQNRLNNGSGNSASRNTVFLSTQNLPGAEGQLGQPEWNAWISAEGRSYSGGYDGSTVDVVLGADRLVSDDLIVGALLAYGRTDIQDATQQTQATSVALGAYFATRLQGDLFLDGFITHARPDYEIGANSFTATRTSAALSFSGNYSGGRLSVSPFAKLNGYREAQPAYGAVAANDITSFNASLGAKVEPLAAMAGGLVPYVSVAYDYGSRTSTANGSETFTSPRLGAGFSTLVGAGYLSVDLDAGKVQSDVRDIGLRATYEFNF